MLESMSFGRFRMRVIPKTWNISEPLSEHLGPTCLAIIISSTFFRETFFSDPAKPTWDRHRINVEPMSFGRFRMRVIPKFWNISEPLSEHLGHTCLAIMISSTFFRETFSSDPAKPTGGRHRINVGIDVFRPFSYESYPENLEHFGASF